MSVINEKIICFTYLQIFTRHLNIIFTGSNLSLNISKRRSLYEILNETKKRSTTSPQMSDSRRKLLLKSSKDMSKSNINKTTCTGRTVKEITQYFEDICRRNSSNKFNIGNESNLCSDVSNTLKNFSNTGSIFYVSKSNIAYPNIYKKCPLSFARKSNLLRCDINLHVMWKRAMLLHGKNFDFKRSNIPQCKKNPRNPFNMRETLRSGLMAGILMLQYII